MQTSQTGGQWYSDTSPFSVPWFQTPGSVASSFHFQFKQKISAEFGSAPLEQLCLIFAGKIMKDHETLTRWLPYKTFHSRCGFYRSESWSIFLVDVL